MADPALRSAWFVSAAHKSSGKTTVSVGLAAALRRRGRSVQTFKKGPDYIDPMWLARASGRPSVNLDMHLMRDDEIGALFDRWAARAEVAIVEGNKGLHDGVAVDGRNSSAALARRLALPVVLVIDARGMTRGVAPLLLGQQAFDPQVRIAGVILNQVGGSRHESKLRVALEHYTDLPVLGAIAADPRLALPERHLGLMPDREMGDAQARVDTIGQVVSQQVDLERLLEATRMAPVIAALQPATFRDTPPVRGERVRIGIARDAAFGFYYPDDLEALQAAGADLIPFDTLHDVHLPATVDALFIGGGFPECFMDALQANASLRGEIRQAVEAGLPVYAECGGLMYLSRSLSWKGRTAQMVGAIPGDACMHERPVGRGYVRLQPTLDHPWPGSAAAEATPGFADDDPAGGCAAGDSCESTLRGHEFHHSSLDRVDPGVRYAYRVLRGHGVDGRHDGLRVHRVLASYAHLRHTGGNDWPRRFVDFVRTVRDAGADTTAPDGTSELPMRLEAAT